MKQCTVEGCARPTLAKGLCESHYGKQHYANRGECEAPGCSSKSMTQGFCTKHKAGAPQGQRFCLHCGISITHKRTSAKFCSRVHSVSWRYWNVPGVRERAQANCHARENRRKSAGLRRGSLSKEEIKGHWPGIE